MKFITLSVVSAVFVVAVAAGMSSGGFGYPMYGYGGGYGGAVGQGFGGGIGGGGLFSALISLVFMSFFFQIIGDLFDNDDDDNYYRGGKHYRSYEGHEEDY